MNETGSKPNAQPMDAFGTLEDLDCRGRRVFVRVDPQVFETLDEAPAATSSEGEVQVAMPARASSTLRRLLELEARIVVATHFTPEARAETGLDGVEALATRLSEQLGAEVFMPDEPVGDAAQRVIQELRQGQLCVLPDLFDHPGEQRQEDQQ